MENANKHSSLLNDSEANILDNKLQQMMAEGTQNVDDQHDKNIDKDDQHDKNIDG